MSYDHWKTTEPSRRWDDEQDRLDEEFEAYKDEHWQEYEEDQQMTTYDEWKSTEPDDPYADELELERRDAEMEPGEDDVIDSLDWSDLNDEADNINIITGKVEE